MAAKKRRIKRTIYFLLGLSLAYFVLNAFRIYSYSFNYSEANSDVAIVLGAGTSNGELSPVFRERIKHSIYLWNTGVVKSVIFTGGYGEGQLISDSEVARQFAIQHGIPSHQVLIEEQSNYTFENLEQAKLIMDSLGYSNALLVSDPMHMKRSLAIAKDLGIPCKSSPTKTSMYQSSTARAKQLLYEAFFFSLREPLSLF